MNTKEILLVGGGGHCISSIDVIESTNEYRIGGIIDIKEKIDIIYRNIYTFCFS